jgi:hypothetical protein
MSKRVALLVLAVVAAGCSSSTSDDQSSEEAQTAGANLSGWSDVSYGVARKDNAGSGSTALVVYGGYGAQPQHSQSWALAIAAARPDLDLGFIYAIRGPRDAGYNAKEIGNRALSRELTSVAPTRIVMLAHSSGGYVADEILNDFDNDMLSRIDYFDLDGGTAGLTNTIARNLRSLNFVWAHASNVGLSRNGAFMKSQVQAFAGSKGTQIEAVGSGCLTSNCLHDTLITSKPHDHNTFNVALDYTDFTGRQVRVSYLPQ